MKNDNPYLESKVIEYQDGSKTLERYWFFPNSSTKYTIHTVLSDETLQDIALRYYNDSGSWYKIADYNSILDPFNEITSGMKILIPL